MRLYTVDQVIEKIENRMNETKTPCKLYKTYNAAHNAAYKMSGIAMDHFGIKEVSWTIAYIPRAGKYTPIFDMTSILEQGVGGYIGLFAHHNFYSH